MKLVRYEKNPILKPTDNWWENRFVLNPGAVYHGGRVHLLYRAVGDDNISRFGYASSADGFDFDTRWEIPAYEPALDNLWERLGCEDPRITYIDGRFFIVYTAASLYAADHGPTFGVGPPWRCRVSMISTLDFRSYEYHGVILPDQDDKDAALFPEKIDGKYVLLHRILPNICVSYSDDLLHWTGATPIMGLRQGYWDSFRIGGGNPPIKTEKGWLSFYHGVDSERVYRLGIMLQDLDDPSKVIYRSEEPVLEPEKSHEREGWVSNVVFSCGAVEKDGQFIVYYGGADSIIGAASISKERILSSLK